MKVKFDVDADALAPPRPLVTAANQPYWDALAAGTIAMQRCAHCRRWVHYPRPRCPGCGHGDMRFEVVDGDGTIYTFTIARQPTAPHFHREVPQAIAVVELPNGVRVTSTIITGDPRRLRVGATVTPVFERGADGITLLRFRLLDEPS